MIKDEHIRMAVVGTTWVLSIPNELSLELLTRVGTRKLQVRSVVNDTRSTNNKHVKLVLIPTQNTKDTIGQ